MGGAEVEAVFILPVGSRMRGIQTIGAGPSAAHLPSAGAGGGGGGGVGDSEARPHGCT